MQEQENQEAAERPQGPPIPEELPVVRLRQGIIYPGMLAPLTITNEDDGALIDEALSRDRIIGLVAQREAEADRPGPEGLYEIGSAAVLQQMLQMPDGGRRLLIRGLTRLRVLGETGPVKEASITGLQSRRITAFVNLDDLPLDLYDLEVALLDRDGKQLKRTLSEYEVLPPVL